MKKIILITSMAVLLSMFAVKTNSQVENRTNWYQNSDLMVHYGPTPATFDGVLAPGYKDQIRELLRRTGADRVQIMGLAQDGLTMFPTRAGIPNPGLQGADVMRIWRDVTDETGVKLFTFFSYLVSGAEAAAHPEFCQVNENGEKTRFLCHNSPYIEDIILPKVRELIRDYDIDGILLAGTIDLVHPCYCPHCVKGFNKQYGQDPPKDRNDPLWSDFINYRKETFIQSTEKVADYVHKLKPSCIFTASSNFTLIQPEKVSPGIDIISDAAIQWYRAQTVSLKSRYLDTQGLPWEILIGGDFHGRNPNPPPSHFNPKMKSREYLCQEASLVLANGGQLYLYASPQPNGALPPYPIELMGKVGDFARERLDVFLNTEPIRDVGILHSSSTYYHEKDLLGDLEGNHTGSWVPELSDRIEGAHIAMVKNNYHVNILADYDLETRLKDYRVIILSQQTSLTPETIRAIRNYVKEGGKIVAAGKVAMDPNSTDAPRSLLEDVFGVRFLDTISMPVAYISWNGYVMRVQCEWYPVETTTARKIHSMNRDWDEVEPSELPYPAMTVNEFGKGTVVYIPGDIFSIYMNDQYFGTREMIEKAMVHADNNKIIETNAPVAVEFSLRKKENDMIVHMVNRLVDWDMDDVGSMHVGNIPPTAPFYLGIRCDREPGEVVLKPSNQMLDWTWRNGYVRVTIPGVHIHEALVIKGAGNAILNLQ